MGTVVGGGGGRLWSGSTTDSGDTDTPFAISSLGGDPARKGVPDAGVVGPEEESSLFSLSSCNCSSSDARSSSSSNTGSLVVSGTSSWCDSELPDTLKGFFTEGESESEKSHESKVSWDVDEGRLRSSWRWTRGGSPSKIRLIGNR